MPEKSLSGRSLPYRITVSEVLSARYQPGTKPTSWDKRVDGIDVIKTIDNEILALASQGGQSTPDKGWILLLTEVSGETELPKYGKLVGHTWTLYGLNPVDLNHPT